MITGMPVSRSVFASRAAGRLVRLDLVAHPLQRARFVLTLDGHAVLLGHRTTGSQVRRLTPRRSRPRARRRPRAPAPPRRRRQPLGEDFRVVLATVRRHTVQPAGRVGEAVRAVHHAPATAATVVDLADRAAGGQRRRRRHLGARTDVAPRQVRRRQRGGQRVPVGQVAEERADRTAPGGDLLGERGVRAAPVDQPVVPRRATSTPTGTRRRS